MLLTALLLAARPAIPIAPANAGTPGLRPAWAASAAPGPLHVPSPDWRDQVVYFLMTDRFANGDRANDSQGAGEHGPNEADRYNGGDLSGLREQLDYVQGLGATAVWLTPPVANVWWDPALKMAGYHGYWTENFREIDKHLGTLADYQALSRELHRRGMFLVQDIVANHTGDFTTFEAGALKPKPGVVPPKPSQAPFDRPDAEIYHQTPTLADFKDETRRLTEQLSGLDDLNTASPAVREALRASYGHWIATAGVDAFRVDTAHYVEHDFWRDFVHSRSTSAPGVRAAAAATGRGGFMAFGEVWVHDAPFQDASERVAARYLGSPEAPELDAVLNFPLAEDLRAVFAKGAPPSRLAYRLDGLNRNFLGGRGSVHFLDNHDMARFLAEGTQAGLVQGLAALLTIPGLPVIYAGTEQGFTETRAAMFKDGFGSGGRDRFDRSHPLYRTIRELTGVRRRRAVFRRGRLSPVAGAAGGPGLLAYRLEEGNASALVVFNTAEEMILAANLDTGLPPGAVLEVLWSRGSSGRRLATDEGGRLSLRLPPRSTLVLEDSGRRERPKDARAAITLDPIDADIPRPAPFELTGTVRGAPSVHVVVDGRIARAISARVDPAGRWRATIDPAEFTDGPHTLAATAGLTTPARAPRVSGTGSFTARVPWTKDAETTDPSGDDRGPNGAYRYPLAAGFEGRGDIAGLTLWRRGGDLRVVIRMAEPLSTAWNPPNGFDHAAFHLWLDLGPGGRRDLMGLNATAPEGFAWDYAVFLSGWKVASFDARVVGRPPLPTVRTQRDAIEATLARDALPPGMSFDGARVYVTTWDYDGVAGVFRELKGQPEDYSFGGGSPFDPLVLDDAGPLSLSQR